MAEILEIDKKFLDSLEKADKSLEKLAETTDKLSDTFNRLLTGSLDPLVRKLEGVASSAGDISKVKVGDLGLKSLGDVATETVDKINEIASVLDKIVVNGQTYSNSALDKNASDLQAAYKKFEELRNQMNAELAEGKAYGDTSELRGNLEYMMEYITLLEKERAQIIKNGTAAVEVYNEEIEANKKAAQMYGWAFDEIDEKNAQLNAQAKKNSEEYQKDLAERQKVWRRHFEEIENKEIKAEAKRRVEAEKTAQKEIEAEEKRHRIAMDNAQKEHDEKQKLYQTAFGTTTGQSLATFQASIASDVTNANNLRNAIKALDKSEGNYKEKKRMLNEELAVYNNRIRQAYRESELFRGSQSKLLSVLSQAKGIIASYFSIYAISNFTKKMVQVTGEFELQNRALQAILQNKDEANRLWQQTVDLAVKSPFTVKELVTYTKQLAAYRVETSKLHGTTKMLADISAGLGVEMNRLVLAYGQVKAANYLRGTELRQFSEAGINILEELRDYYAEVENKILSVGDVFEMVSRREVSFGDVEAVLQRVTGKGGPFYRMQEIQAETVKGMMSNLQDSFDIMMNDIGESTEGVIKGVLTVTKKLLDNWETVLKVVTAVVATYGTFKTMLKLTNASVIANAMSFEGLIKPGQKALNIVQLLRLGVLQVVNGVKKLEDGMQVVSLSDSWKNFTTGVNGATLAITAFAAAMFTVVMHIRKMRKEARELNIVFERQTMEITKMAKSFGDSAGNIDKLKMELSNLAEYANQEFNITFNVESVEDNIESIALAYQQLGHTLVEAADNARLLGQVMLDNEDKQFWSNALWYLSWRGNGNRAEKDLEQFADKYREVQVRLMGVVGDVIREEGESELDYMERLLAGYETTLDEHSNLIDGKTKRAVRRYNRTMREAQKEMNDIYQEFGEKAFKDPIAIKAAIDKMATEKELTGILPWLYRWAEENLNIVIPVTVGGQQERELAKWQERFARLFNVSEIITDESFKLPKYIVDIFDTELSSDEAATKVEEELNRVTDIYNTAKNISEEDWMNSVFFGEDRESFLSDLEAGIKLLTDQRAFFKGYADDKKKSGEDESRSINRRIDLLKDMRSEYEKLSETFTELEAKQRIIDSYAGTFADAMAGTGKSISDYDFTEDAGLLEMLRALRPFAAQEGREISLLLAKEISSTQATMDVEIRTVQNEQVLQSIEDLFTGYEVGLQLEELNIPPELAKELFGLDSIDLDSLRAQVASKLPLLTGDEALKQHEEYLKKIDEMEEKAQMERVKKYSEYLLKSNNEFVAAQLEALRQLREIDQTFTDPAQREAARGGILRELNEKEQKMQWDSFQSSDMYIMMFEDIENMGTKAIEILLNRLQDLRSNLTDLPPSDLKEIVNQINKLETELATRNPFTSIRDTIKEINSLGDIGALQEQIAALSERQDIIKAQLDAYNTISQAYEEGLAIETSTQSWQTYIQLMDDAKESGMALEEYVAQITQESKDNVKNLKEATDEYNKQKTALKKINEAIANYNANLGAIRTMCSSITEATGAFGVELDGNLNTIIETVFALGELRSKYLEWQADRAAGDAAKNLASGPLGWVVLAVQALMTVISLVAKLSENRKAKRIENIRKDIERLNTAMEDLKEAIDAAFSLSQLQDYSEQTKANIEDQIRLQKQIIKLREKGYTSKKEREEINAAKEEIEQLEKEKEEILRDLVSTATAGILDNTLDAAKSIVDAWYDSFQEIGDGMEGLEKSFQEMLVNILKQQATLGIAGAFADRWKQELTKYVNADDLTFTASEAQQWVETVKKDFPELSAALEAYFEALRSAGVEIEDAGELSTLQRGIQGITETQADVIAAYLNSLRFFVQQGNQDRLNFFASFNNPDTPNPILSQLKAIAKNTEAIYTLLESVSGTNHPKGGSGIKVFID